ncbi:MAG TPA: heparan-alpha-glucosaminide N-acetyltransferase domain-containing protein [Puia sp.]
MKRISSIDIIRGLVMVLMPLDHVRDLLHTTSMTQNPTDLTTTTPILFFTRWITHLCAPAFVFLAGASAWLSLAAMDKQAGRRFLLTRGLALIAIELTLVNFGMNFDLRFRYFLFEVIATIGAGFILLSLLSRLSWGGTASRPRCVGALYIASVY